MSFYTAPKFGLPNQTPWDWQVSKPSKRIDVDMVVRNMKKKAHRVNPDALFDSGFVPKSLRAPR